MTNEQVKATTLAKVRELSKALGRDARSLKSSDVIPSSGALDSAAIPQEDFTLENFGSVDQMAAYVAVHIPAV